MAPGTVMSWCHRDIVMSLSGIFLDKFSLGSHNHLHAHIASPVEVPLWRGAHHIKPIMLLSFTPPFGKLTREKCIQAVFNGKEIVWFLQYVLSTELNLYHIAINCCYFWKLCACNEKLHSDLDASLVSVCPNDSNSNASNTTTCFNSS